MDEQHNPSFSDLDDADFMKLLTEGSAGNELALALEQQMEIAECSNT